MSWPSFTRDTKLEQEEPERNGRKPSSKVETPEKDSEKIPWSLRIFGCHQMKRSKKE